MKFNGKVFDLIVNENDLVTGAYTWVRGQWTFVCPYIRPVGMMNRPTYYGCSGEYTAREVYNRMRSGRLIFK